jgi:hypothetical protein
MTLEVYSKYIPNKNRNFGKIFNESFWHWLTLKWHQDF